jgi:hypothetical protein
MNWEGLDQFQGGEKAATSCRSSLGLSPFGHPAGLAISSHCRIARSLQAFSFANSNCNPFHLVEVHFVAPAIVELAADH